jgi:hypothetical protein
LKKTQKQNTLLAKMARARAMATMFHMSPFTVEDQNKWKKVLHKLIISTNREQ